MLPLPQLKPRSADSYKGDFGRALLVGGSRGMAGAISLSGMSTLRSGAGLVQLAVPTGVQATVASFEPSYMTVDLPEDHKGRMTASARSRIARLAETATAVACGPGLGRSPGLTKLVGWLFAKLNKPLVIDADGLYALAQCGRLAPRAADVSRILTPHEGEFRRLVPTIPPEASRDDLIAEAKSLAARANVVIVLKGHNTLITDGQRWAINRTGNPGMATGGTGDVLTGVITALLCQGLDAFEAAQLGVHLHGLAGDLAAAELGEVSLIASDLLRFLPAAFQQAQAT
jgi:NAD(P)H-hydrate epimerase